MNELSAYGGGEIAEDHLVLLLCIYTSGVFMFIVYLFVSEYIVPKAIGYILFSLQSHSAMYST